MADNIFFSAKRHERGNAIPRDSPLLTEKPHRACSAKLTPQALPRPVRMGGG